MTADTALPDLDSLLALDFNRADLAAAKLGMRSSRDFRRDVESRLQSFSEDSSGAEGHKRAVLLYLLSRPEQAARYLGEGDTPELGLLSALVSLENADPAGAASRLGALVGTKVEDADMLRDLATASALAGDSAMALKAAQKIPQGANQFYAEGIALESDGEYGEACLKYEAALDDDPQHARALFRLANRYDLQGEDEKAIELYRRLIQLQPTYVNALLNLGLLYEDRNRYQEAEACYRRVLKADPVHVRARIGLKDVQASLSMYYDEDHERREDRRNQTLRTPISEFELSVRSRNCLAKMHIETLGDLVRKTEPELLAYKNFGETSLQEIKDILAQKGLRLGMVSEDDAPLAAGRPSADDQVAALFGAPSASSSSAGSGGANDPFALPIEHLDLSIRARRCMDNLDIRMVGDLMQRTEAELLASKNFGQTSLNEVRRKLDALGLTLRRK